MTFTTKLRNKEACFESCSVLDPSWSYSFYYLVWWLGYRLKYAELIKVENEEPNDYCDFCGGIFVNAEFIATDRPPPSFEFVGLVDPCD